MRSVEMMVGMVVTSKAAGSDRFVELDNVDTVVRDVFAEGRMVWRSLITSCWPVTRQRQIVLLKARADSSTCSRSMVGPHIGPDGGCCVHYVVLGRGLRRDHSTCGGRIVCGRGWAEVEVMWPYTKALSGVFLTLCGSDEANQ